MFVSQSLATQGQLWLCVFFSLSNCFKIPLSSCGDRTLLPTKYDTVPHRLLPCISSHSWEPFNLGEISRLLFEETWRPVWEEIESACQKSDCLLNSFPMISCDWFPGDKQTVFCLGVILLIPYGCIFFFSFKVSFIELYFS